MAKTNNMVPDGWAIRTLSDLASIDNKSLKNNTDPDYRFRYIDIASVKTAKVDIPTEYVSFGESPSRARKCVRKGDVLMSTVRPNLKGFAYFDVQGDDFVASTGFAVISAKKSSSGRFLYQSILSDDVTRQIESLVAGSNYPAISSVNVKSLEILSPPLPEQQKIAAILSSVDEVIEKTRAQIDKLKDLKTGMMQELLTKGVGVDGVPHTEFKDSPVGRIPAGWMCEKIGELFEVQLGKMLSKAAKAGDSPFPYLGNKNVQWGKVDISELEKMDFSEREKKKFSLQGGDLLMCEGGDVGRSAIWEGELENCYYQKAIHRLRPINKAYEPRLLLEYMRYAKQVNLLVDFISQTSIAHLTRTNLISIPVPVPLLAEQKEIVAICSSIDSRVYAVEDKLTNLKKIKKALMQDLLTGKVRVNVTDKETAAV